MSDKEKSSILVAEDSKPNRTILVNILEKLGFDVDACANGSLAWEAFSKEKSYLCVLSDIMMPEMNGIELLEKVRLESEKKETPFVLVTAVSDKEHIVRAKELEVNGYILKPITADLVLQKLQSLFPDMELKFPKF